MRGFYTLDVEMEPLPPAHIPVTRMMKKPGKCGPAICTGGKEEYGFF